MKILMNGGRHVGTGSASKLLVLTLPPPPPPSTTLHPCTTGWSVVTDRCLTVHLNSSRSSIKVTRVAADFIGRANNEQAAS